MCFKHALIPLPPQSLGIVVLQDAGRQLAPAQGKSPGCDQNPALISPFFPFFRCLLRQSFPAQIGPGLRGVRRQLPHPPGLAGKQPERQAVGGFKPVFLACPHVKAGPQDFHPIHIRHLRRNQIQLVAKKQIFPPPFFRIVIIPDEPIGKLEEGAARASV